MRRPIPKRFLPAAFLFLVVIIPSVAFTVDATPPSSGTVPSNIVIGFVGGFVSHDDPHRGPVKLAQRIRQSIPQNTYVRVFENRKQKQAYDTIVSLLDTNHDGVLSLEERACARIILFGQSWGASATLNLARRLREQKVPVLLTIQVDSVAKLGQNDSIVPDNVAQAVNFYQTHGIIHGRRQITAADPAKTQILGNYLMDYSKNPVECPDSSWWDRAFTPGHMQSECDPQLWSQIEKLVQQHLSPHPTPKAIPPAELLRQTH